MAPTGSCDFLGPPCEFETACADFVRGYFYLQRTALRYRSESRTAGDPLTAQRSGPGHLHPEPSSQDKASDKGRSGRSVVFCRTCAVEHAIEDTRTESTHRSAEGLVGYVRCPQGHLTIHLFAEAYPKPPPPASVVALRARLAAERRTSEPEIAATVTYLDLRGTDAITTRGLETRTIGDRR